MQQAAGTLCMTEQAAGNFTSCLPCRGLYGPAMTTGAPLFPTAAGLECCVVIAVTSFLELSIL